MTAILNPDRDFRSESRPLIIAQNLLKSPEESILHVVRQLRRYLRKLVLIEHQSKYSFLRRPLPYLQRAGVVKCALKRL